MTLHDIYTQAIRLGVEADPRGKEGVQQVLDENRKTYKELKGKDKEYYDKERFENPYSDTRILYSEGDREVRKVLAEIDIEGSELLVARQLGDIDAVISHHPEGGALLGLDDVMRMQADLLNQYGVPINVAEGLLHKRISEVSRGLAPSNHYRAVEIARLLNIPFMCAHTATDNLAYQFLKGLIEGKKPYSVRDILDTLQDIPEYHEAAKMGAGPRLFAGKKENRAGKVAVTEITGGTEGAHDIYEKMAQAGIGTVISMHQSEKHRENAELAHINVVIAGHMSSDSVGMNIFLDSLERNGVLVAPCSGLIRVSRNVRKV